MRKLSYWGMFNFIVGVTGVVSLAMMEVIGARTVRPGEDFVEPLAMLAGVLVFGLVSNAVFVTYPQMEEDQFEQRALRVLLWCTGLATAPIWLALFALVRRG